MIRISVDTRDIFRELPERAEKEMVKLVNEALKIASARTKVRAQGIFFDKLADSYGLYQLLGIVAGEAGAFFGVLPQEVNAVVLFVSGLLNVRVIRPYAKKAGGIYVELMPGESFDRAIEHSAASFISTNGFLRRWLRDVLYSGGDFQANIMPFYGAYPTSRTGQTIMVNTMKHNWPIPIIEGGKEGDNWITRSAIACLPEISNILKEEMVKVF